MSDASTTHSPTKCHLCGGDAIAVFYFSHGCVCDPATVQPLCLHHAMKSGPAGRGSMELIKDLTVGEAFREAWRTGVFPGMPAA